MTRVLGIESTCDETAAAVVEDGRRVLSSVVASQADLHARYRGVVPEIASRAHLQNILPAVEQALAQAGVGLTAIDAVSVTHRPGLIGSLLIGLTAAKALAWAAGRPLIGVDHVQAHLYSVCVDTEAAPPMPAVGLVCSGGHTALYAVRRWTEIDLLGRTVDDAVGEAYDKVAALLGLGFPGGPAIDRLAARGDAGAVRFPRTLLARDSLDFSFSGIKTAVLYHVRGVPGRAAPPPPDERGLADVAASFQAACVDVLMEKLRRAAARLGARSAIVGGGVAANASLRAALPSLGIPVFTPRLAYCTDNAAMSAALASVLLDAGATSGLDLDAATSTALAPAERSGGGEAA